MGNYSDFALQRLINYAGTGEGSILPPQMRASVRVPPPTGFRILKRDDLIGQSVFTLAWDDVQLATAGKVAFYNIYVIGTVGRSSTPVGPYTALRSPAVVTIPADRATNCGFILQPTLTSGLSTPLDLCPSVGASVPSPALTASIINTKQVFVDGLTLTNNSPSAGKIAWSSATVYYNGTSYSISSGSTSATTNQFVYWDVGNSTFTAADTFTPQTGRFLIATNDGGTAGEAWNNPFVGPTIQENNLAFGLITGIAIQPHVTAEADLDPGTTTYTTVLDTSGSGALLNAGIYVSQAPVASVAGPTFIIVDFAYTVDGQTRQVVPAAVYSISGSAMGGGFDIISKCLTSLYSGTGLSLNDHINWRLGVGYNSSLKVEIKVTVTGSSLLSAGKVTGVVLYGTSTN